MTGFHTWHYRCDGVGRDSGCGHEESHLMHDIYIPCRIAFFYGLWYDVCVSLHVHFRWGVTLVGKFIY